jgi:hypothetical protein
VKERDKGEDFGSKSLLFPLATSEVGSFAFNGQTFAGTAFVFHFAAYH